MSSEPNLSQHDVSPPRSRTGAKNANLTTTTLDQSSICTILGDTKEHFYDFHDLAHSKYISLKGQFPVQFALHLRNYANVNKTANFITLA